MADPSPPPPPTSIANSNPPSTTPSNAPPAAASSPSKKSNSAGESLPLDLLQSLRPYMNDTNTTILRINKLLSTTSGLDTILSFVSYSTLLISCLPVPYVPFPLASLSPKPSPTIPRRTLASPSLRNLYSLISDFRVFLRTLDLLKIYSWTLSLHSSPPEDWLLRWNAYAQMANLALYQSLENVAYLAGKGILFRGVGAKRRAQLDAVSCRFWAAWVFGEFVRIAREVQIRRGKIRAGEGKEGAEMEEEEKRRWKKDLIVSGAYFPLCLHWSLESGLGIPEWATGLLGSLAGLVGVREAWRGTVD